ncbi:MAG: AAA family ATPase, partial [Beijerinckiaceae bacterium]|nr:AAA family ATPase [Beijerinckiaceae bacterium]
MAIRDIASEVPAPPFSTRDPGGVLVRRLTLADFRSYAALDLGIDAKIAVLAGENGAGKTNLLEALSLFAPGRGLRRAELTEFARIGGGGGFAVSAELATPKRFVQLGTGIEPRVEWETAPQRKYRINREPAPSVRAFGDYVRVVWLTPAMDGLFAGPAGDRRRFLDRLVLAIDINHGARVSAFERALRSRNRLLEDGAAADRRWLDAIEKETAELAVAIAAARAETVARLSALIAETRETASTFPWAGLELQGDVEAMGLVKFDFLGLRTLT